MASHVPAIYVPELPVLTEIIGSGRMNLFRDNDLRAAMVATQQSSENLLQLIDAGLQASFNLGALYPDLIQTVSYYDEKEQNVRKASNTTRKPGG